MVLAVPPRNEASFDNSGGVAFIQTTEWDMRMHYRLSAEGWNRKNSKASPVCLMTYTD